MNTPPPGPPPSRLSFDFIDTILVDDYRNRWLADLPDGSPCDHPGCLSHVSHPCEVCGRVAGRRGSNKHVDKDILTGTVWPKTIIASPTLYVEVYVDGRVLVSNPSEGSGSRGVVFSHLDAISLRDILLQME